MDALGAQDAHAEDRRLGSARGRQRLADRGILLQRVPQPGRAHDRRGRHQPDRRAARGTEPLHDLVGTGGTGGSRGRAVELDDLRGRGPARAQVRGHLEHRAAPRDADGTGRRERTKVHRRRPCDTLTREELIVRRGSRRGDVDHDGPAEPEPLRQGVLELDQACGRVDDLDPDGCLAQRAVEETADLEPAHAQPLADLVLRQVHPVVELGRAQHQPRLTRERLDPAQPRRAHRHAQMCTPLLMCCSRYARQRAASRGRDDRS